MATNFSAAILAVMLVVIQLYCIGLYKAGPDESTVASPKASPGDFAQIPMPAATLTADDFVLSYDLSSSPALIYLDNALK